MIPLNFNILIVALVFIPLSYLSWNTDNFDSVSYNYNYYWANQEASVPASQNFSIDESDMLSFPNPNGDSAIILKRLSDMVQAKIAHLQKKRCDPGPVLFCGNYKAKCCFGCDFHHRAACLMLSYAWRIPFVHGMDVLYPFSISWNEMFEHLGSNCSETNSNRCTFFWENERNDMVCKHANSTEYFFRNVDIGGKQAIPYPLRNGIPIESKLLDELRSTTKTPCSGLLANFTGTLSSLVRDLEERWKCGDKS